LESSQLELATPTGELEARRNVGPHLHGDHKIRQSRCNQPIRVPDGLTWTRNSLVGCCRTQPIVNRRPSANLHFNLFKNSKFKVDVQCVKSL